MNQNFKTTLKTWPVVFAVAALICFLTKWVAGLLGIELPEQVSLAWLRNAHGLKFAAIVFYVIVAAPVGEEFVFRFLLYKGPMWLFFDSKPFRRLLGRISGARSKAGIVMAILSTVLFVAAHYGKANPFPDNAFIALFFFGLAQCWLYRRTGHLWATMLHHALFNSTNLAFFLLLPE